MATSKKAATEKKVSISYWSKDKVKCPGPYLSSYL